MSVLLATILFLAAMLGWLLLPMSPKLRPISRWCFALGCVSLFAVMACVAILFVANRFEFEYVWDHAEKSNPLAYRVAGIWSGQQGSFLLWGCAAAGFALLALKGTGPFRRWFTIFYSGFLACIAAILAYESPFKLNLLDGRPVVPLDGRGLSPSLQNYWVVFHPPTIFLGFGALTVLAAYAFAATVTGRVHEWIPRVRPWALIALALVGLGLCMGGFWAYETLGWGGFWMWDPVENASFVPWVLTAAFVHGIIVQNTTKRWSIANLLLGSAPFLLFVYGTFLTRSGVLGDTSVHSFASMDHVAQQVLLGLLVLSTLTFLGVWIHRWRHPADPSPSKPGSNWGLHRETFFRLGAVLLAAFAIAAALGMSVPMFMSLAGRPAKVVEEGLYHRVLVWAYFPLMVVMAVAPLTAWHKMGVRALLKRTYGVLCVSLLLTGLAMIGTSASPWTKSTDLSQRVAFPFGLQVGTVGWVLLLAFLSIFVVVANLWRISELFRRSKLSSAAFLAHVGFAILMAGLIISRGLEQKAQVLVQEGSHDLGLGYLVSYKGMTSNLEDRNNKVLLEMHKGAERWTASPGFYRVDSPDGEKSPMVWPYIASGPFYDIYVALHPGVDDAGEELTLEPGQTGRLDRFVVNYAQRTMKGSAGHPGTRFGAVLKVADGGSSQTLNPALELGPNGPIDHSAALGNHFRISLTSMDAATGRISLKLRFARTVYPVDLFYKPMTILVWLGCAIMSLAVLMTAWYRRAKSTVLAQFATPSPARLPRPDVGTGRDPLGARDHAPKPDARKGRALVGPGKSR